MHALENIFSEDNMLAYADSCLELATIIPEKQGENNFDTLVIPSRGAVPFFLGMAYALGKFASSNISEQHTRFYKKLSIEKTLNALLPEDSKMVFDNDGDNVKVLLAPFTADLNIGQFDSRENSDEYTKKTRIYWANFTASLFQNSSNRRKNPYFSSFTEVVLRRIEHRDEIADYYENFPAISRFAMIDTVISGRASTDILSAFDTISLEQGNKDLQPLAFLVVDENGAKLKSGFSRYLNRKKIAGKVEMIRTPRIVSEDKGASLLGIAATVYPSIMRASKSLTLDENEFFVGAGSWRLCSELGPNNLYQENFFRFMNLVYKAIDARFSYGFSSEGFIGAYKIFSDNHKEFVKWAIDRHILGRHKPDVDVLRLRYQPSQILNPYETSSHVLHVPFNEFTTKGIYHLLKELSGVSSKHGSGFYPPIKTGA